MRLNTPVYLCILCIVVAGTGRPARVPAPLPLEQGRLTETSFAGGHLTGKGRGIFTDALSRSILLAAPEPAATAAAIYYVALTGADENSGAADAPWTTLQHAADTAKAGDIVNVLPGTYDEGMNVIGRLGGKEGAPIHFIAQPGTIIRHSAVKGINAKLAAINIEGSAWYVIEGFKIVGDPSIGRVGIRVTGSSHTRILNNTVDGAPMGIFTSNSDHVVVEGNVCMNSTDEHGIYMGANTHNCVVRGNRLVGNQRDGLHTNATNLSPNAGLLAEGNVIYGNVLSGMDIEGTVDAIFRDNVIYNNEKHGIVLHNIDQADTPPCTGNRILNNTICGNGRFAVMMAAGGNTANAIRDNILLSKSRVYGSIGAAELPQRLESDHNVVMNRFSTDLGVTTMSLARWQAATALDAHSTIATAEQLFVNAAAADFRLRPSSPVKSAGATSLRAPAAGGGDSAPTDHGDAPAKLPTSDRAEFSNRTCAPPSEVSR